MAPCRLNSSPNLKPLLLLSSLIFAASILPTPASSTTRTQDLLQPDLVSSLESAIDIVRQVKGAVSKLGLGGQLGDSRLTNAVNDCVDLLDFSADVLGWSVSAAQNHSNQDNGTGTGDVNFDLRTWLSAVLTNQETCLDGFDGADSSVKSIIAGSLGQVTSPIEQLLAQLTPNPKPDSATSSHGAAGHEFPSWVLSEDRKVFRRKRAKVDVVVAQDGSGNFTKVQDAVNAAHNYSKNRFVIHIKTGVYYENVEVDKKKWNIMLVGDGIGATVISGHRNYADGCAPFRSATLGVTGKGFIAQDLTIENTAGPKKKQAVALRSDSDLSVFLRCAFHGYQDTLYPHAMRQFFKDCEISGTVDFIFGDATAFFQNCRIRPRKGLPKQKNTITAQGRKNPNQPTGFSFQFCDVSPHPELLPTLRTTESYLGRPWKNYSRTVFMQSHLSDVIHPKGWLQWNNDTSNLDTLFYAEYMNYGPGADLGSRVKWPGFHALRSSAAATWYTVAQFIAGNTWLPYTGIPYLAGL